MQLGARIPQSYRFGKRGECLCVSGSMQERNRNSNSGFVKHRKSKSSLRSSCFCAHHSAITPMGNRPRAVNSKWLNYLFPGGLGRGEGRQRIVSPDERLMNTKKTESKVCTFIVLDLRGLSTLVFVPRRLKIKECPVDLMHLL